MAVRGKEDRSGILKFNTPQLFKKEMVLMEPLDALYKAPVSGIYHFLYERTLYGSKGNGTSVAFYMNGVLLVNAFYSISKGP